MEKSIWEVRKREVTLKLTYWDSRMVVRLRLRGTLVTINYPKVDATSSTSATPVNSIPLLNIWDPSVPYKS
jgi:hypothetical protein